MTAPLTPPDCDLRDFPTMPMDANRLFGSEFHAMADDGAWRAGVTLWLKSWHQVPAASLPDDDVLLARLAEFARDVDAWHAVKEQALRGWVRCDDGRLYHPVVAEKAMAAWEKKQSYRARSKKGNAARWGSQKDEQPQSDSDPTGTSSSDPSGTATEIPSSSQVKGKGEGYTTGKPVVGARVARRLPPGFVVPDDWLGWAAGEKGWPPAAIREEAASFVDFWHAKAGRDAAKRDWEATWRNWCRKAHRPPGGGAGGDGGGQARRLRLERYREMDEANGTAAE